MSVESSIARRKQRSHRIASASFISRNIPCAEGSGVVEKGSITQRVLKPPFFSWFRLTQRDSKPKGSRGFRVVSTSKFKRRDRRKRRRARGYSHTPRRATRRNDPSSDAPTQVSHVIAMIDVLVRSSAVASRGTNRASLTRCTMTMRPCASCLSLRLGRIDLIHVVAGSSLCPDGPALCTQGEFSRVSRAF